MAQLRRGTRLVFVHVSREQLQKTIRGFFFQEHGLSEKSVAGAVAGGIAFALFGDGATGKGSVGAGGLNLLVGWHKKTFWPQINADERG